jgi:hypothetical protein
MLETKHKQHQTRSAKSVKAKIDDKSQGIWKSANPHYIAMKKERVRVLVSS